MRKKEHKCKANDNRIRIDYDGYAIDRFMFTDNLAEEWLVIDPQDFRDALKKVGYEFTLIPTLSVMSND
jgi:hypothetical protein